MSHLGALTCKNSQQKLQQKIAVTDIQKYTVSHKKPCHFVFVNNSGVSWSILILFVPIETGRNTV